MLLQLIKSCDSRIKLAVSCTDSEYQRYKQRIYYFYSKFNSWHYSKEIKLRLSNICEKSIFNFLEHDNDSKNCVDSEYFNNLSEKESLSYYEALKIVVLLGFEVNISIPLLICKSNYDKILQVADEEWVIIEFEYFILIIYPPLLNLCI